MNRKRFLKNSFIGGLAATLVNQKLKADTKESTYNKMMQ
jgi:hypothetical protein